MTFAKKSKSGPSDANVNNWITAFLSEKSLSSPMKVIEWQAWASQKLSNGWSSEAVKQRIREAWREWVSAGNVDVNPLEPELRQAMNDVYKMADEGAAPEACAVVYRSLAKQYPHRYWIRDAALLWEEMGKDWKLTPTPDR